MWRVKTGPERVFTWSFQSDGNSSGFLKISSWQCWFLQEKATAPWSRDQLLSTKHASLSWNKHDTKLLVHCFPARRLLCVPNNLMFEGISCLWSTSLAGLLKSWGPWAVSKWLLAGVYQLTEHCGCGTLLYKSVPADWCFKFHSSRLKSLKIKPGVISGWSLQKISFHSKKLYIKILSILEPE